MNEMDALTKEILLAVSRRASSAEQAIEALLSAVEIVREDASMADSIRSCDMALMPMSYT